MALWSEISKMPPEQFNVCSDKFPHNLRCILGDWLENNPWEFITGSDSFCAFMANSLLSAMVETLQDLANKSYQSSLILQLMANLENTYRRDPLQLARTVKQILEAEQVAVQNKLQCLPLSFRRQQEELKFEFDLKRLQYKLQEIQALHGNLRDSSRVSLQINTMDPQFSPQADPLQTFRTLFPEVTKELEATKTRLLKRLDIWKRQQQLAGNGTPFNDDLAPLQKRFESLVDVCFQFHYQMAASAAELGSELQSHLQECLKNVFNTLIESSFLVDKQPPQVLKTQTKFQATIRFLLGPHLFKSPQTVSSVTANIVTEKQARELAAGHSDSSLSSEEKTENDLKATCESTGEIVNNIAPLETIPTSNACCAVFKNMLLKKIKRSDRKSSESVTEEKCAVLFSAKINIGFNNTTFQFKVFSLPIVVIVHGNQDNNAKATILWDNAFATKDRIPFVVTERVPWGSMCEALNQKFMAEVQTPKGLCVKHNFFLAQKIFNDYNSSYEDFQSRCVSWSQFNKEILPGRGFTFWQWFEGVLDLTKKYLRDYWSDNLIMGFASRQYVSSCLSSTPTGSFLLRFSDSLIGGISIAYVNYLPNGSPQVENVEPFTATKLSIHSLADCVRDLQELQMLYPDRPKEDAFRKYFNEELPKKKNKEYIPTLIKITVGIPSNPAPLQPNFYGSMPNINGSPGISTIYSEPSDPVALQSNLSSSMPTFSGNPGIPTPAHCSDPSSMMSSQVVSHVYMSSLNTRYDSPVMQVSPHSSNTEWVPQENAPPLGPLDLHLFPQELAMDIGLPERIFHGDMDCPMQLEQIAPENLFAPSNYELDQLLHHEQHLLHYSHSPGPSLTNLCS